MQNLQSKREMKELVTKYAVGSDREAARKRALIQGRSKRTRVRTDNCPTGKLRKLALFEALDFPVFLCAMRPTLKLWQISALENMC